MRKRWFLRIRSDSGSLTAEAAFSISFLVICGIALVQVLTFAMQYHRLQALAQESSRVAASLEDPEKLENQVTSFIKNINNEIRIEFVWSENYVEVVLREPTSGVVTRFVKSVEVSASAPRWSG